MKVRAAGQLPWEQRFYARARMPRSYLSTWEMAQRWPVLQARVVSLSSRYDCGPTCRMPAQTCGNERWQNTDMGFGETNLAYRDYFPVPIARHPISPLEELGAYEALWKLPDASFKSIAELFRKHPGSVPSEHVDAVDAAAAANQALGYLSAAGIESFGVRVHGAGEYPLRLRDAKEPIELLYYRGWWDLVDSHRSIAVVGTREISDEGLRRTRKLVRELVRHDFTIVSGLARGVDTAVHEATIEAGGRTIAVVGTPLNTCYPKENRDLQERIARDFLVISQIPIIRYAQQDYRLNRLFFPERNKTMSALTLATVIVEAGETSGTLIQAQAALEQNRKVFILDSCFQNAAITWPAKYEKRGAIRVHSFDDIPKNLPVSEL